MPHDDALSTYRSKRDPGRTPEPFGGAAAGSSQLRFVIQKHAARQLHYDFRLELDGVLKSWAVPKGPSYDQANKRAAILVEDHPLEYAEFEGVIPEGNYGAGPVIVWDCGVWMPIEDANHGLEKGKLLFELRGHKLRGRWTLVRTNRGPNDWLLIKERDAYMRADADAFDEASVVSGLTLDELRAGSTRAPEIRAELKKLSAPQRTVRVQQCKPMLAERAPAPFDAEDWIFEFKFDGYRFLAGRDGDAVVLQTRNGHDWTASFPEIARAIGALPFERFIIDGEMVVHDDIGLPSFQRLQKRARLKRAPDIRRAAVDLPATFYVFDLLAFDDCDVRPLPLVERKRLLRRMLPAAGMLRYSDHVAHHGTALYGQVESLGLEGVIAKRAQSPYRAGRSADWQKVRAHRTDEFVVVGWKRASDNADAIGSLHLGLYDESTLRYAGSVGTGFDGKLLRSLHERLAPSIVARSPAAGAPRSRDAVWVEPTLVVEVRYLEWTDDQQLRHPVFVRIREDKQPHDCVRGTATVSDEVADNAASIGTVDEDAASKREVRLSNLDKLFWPEDGYTKGDLVEYYRTIAPWLIPYLAERPIVLTRFPDGIDGKSFFQKDAPQFAPDWIRTETLWSEGSERALRYFVGGDEATLVYLANSASIPLHVWASRVGTLEHPDWCILDLDPKGAPFTDVVEVARALKELCDEIALPCFIKTSGSSGLHVLIPLGRQLTHEQSKQLGELIARVVVKRVPEIATIARVISQREGKVYVDYLQNGHGKLLVAPFSVRPLPGAPVSTPLEWREVNKRLDIRRFTIRTVPVRMKRLGRDPLRAVLEVKPDLLGALQALSALA